MSPTPTSAALSYTSEQARKHGPFRAFLIRWEGDPPSVHGSVVRAGHADDTAAGVRRSRRRPARWCEPHGNHSDVETIGRLGDVPSETVPFLAETLDRLDRYGTTIVNRRPLPRM